MKYKDIYQEIAALLIGLVPEAWTKILLSADVKQESSSIYFYYYTPDADKPIYSLDIEDLFSIDTEVYLKQEYQLEKTVRILRENMASAKGDYFTNMTFIVDSSGKFTTEFSYDDLEDDPVVRKKMWVKKYLI